MAIGGVQFGSSLLVTFVDRTAEQAHSEALEKMAFIDALTGLPPIAASLTKRCRQDGSVACAAASLWRCC